MPPFTPGRTLSRAFYAEILRPLLGDRLHDACLIGEGSDVLGYDQRISMDHDWGPRVTLFFASEEECNAVRGKVLAQLPDSFREFPTRKDRQASNICITTATRWLREHLRIEDIDALKAWDWLAFPQQHLLQFTGGALFCGTLGHYQHAREILAWYPLDVWRWMMAAQWYFVWSSERLIFRAAEAGDALGVRLLLHKLIRICVELVFLQNKAYRPYDKWLGTAFAQIGASHGFAQEIVSILNSQDLREQTSLWQKLLVQLGENHNLLGITRPVAPLIRPYEVGIDGAVRPYRIFNAAGYTNACTESIADPAIKSLACVGALDQMANATDAFINFSPWNTIVRDGFRAQLTQEP